MRIEGFDRCWKVKVICSNRIIIIKRNKAVTKLLVAKVELMSEFIKILLTANGAKGNGRKVRIECIVGPTESKSGFKSRKIW
jgi:hypothetical protein